MGGVVGDEAGEARVLGLGKEEMERLALHRHRCGAARFPLGVAVPGGGLLRSIGLSSCSRTRRVVFFAQTCEYIRVVFEQIYYMIFFFSFKAT